MSDQIGVQEITKAIKAALIIAGLAGVQIAPEHQTVIMEGGAVLYALLAGTEWWDKRRKRIVAPEECQ